MARIRRDWPDQLGKVRVLGVPDDYDPGEGELRTPSQALAAHPRPPGAQAPPRLVALTQEARGVLHGELRVGSLVEGRVLGDARTGGRIELPFAMPVFG